ncbi:hypothetical protein ElyMa_000846300 [Elysia marginata]|uniref:Uncharacterized protein n=1 Tax=Elysia marginata TaxID=1093978 RepID=A0AAV4H207_9GAST|nr:hypothetical protein ElyMa_000846300 [Elysia marginata]
MGLQGEGLRDWVDNQMKEEERRKREEFDRKKEERELEQKERDEKKLEMELQKELVEEEKELLRMKLESPVGLITMPTRKQQSATVKAPRLPPFEDHRDQIDSYLLRYERYAKTNGWPETS